MKRFIAALLMIVMLGGTSSFACGPFVVEAVFVHTVHPDFPLEQYAGGRLGVVQPSYARSYLYVAYRYLAGMSFTPAEQKGLTELWSERLNLRGVESEEDLTKDWLAARQKISGVPPLEYVTVYRTRPEPNQYESYLNCPADAFKTAIATLEERIAKYGAQDPSVKAWVAAQDQVFANCSKEDSIPEQISASDPLARADRSYQIAAAHFYSENFDAARKAFETIAADASSPWQRHARYLIARTFIREASLGSPETKQESLRQAESQLQLILKDEQLANLHASATRLLNLVKLRLRPAERVHELAQQLLAPNENANLKQDLWDYTNLLDVFLEDEEPKPNADLKRDELSDWITTFQSSEPAARDHSLARWEATNAHPWLLAVLTKIDGQHPRAGELISAALNVNSNFAAFASARFHAVRLLLELGKEKDARALLDQLLTTERAQLEPSALNLLIGRRMQLAENLDEFLRDAARVPTSLSFHEDGRELPARDEELSDEHQALKDKPLFDVDAGNALNHQFPLTVLQEAVKDKALPAHLRRDLAQAVWLRAALLDDTKTADEMVPILRTLVPELSSLLNTYLSATQPEEKKFAAIYAWLKFPGLEPVVDVGLGREAPLAERDSYRDNWWCGSAFPEEPYLDEGPQSFTSVSTKPPRFLSTAQLKAGTNEWAALRAFGAAPNYISRQVIEWANRSPRDPRAPEALHLAVRATRYGCTDKDTGRWSRAAFELLHRKYPRSTWARRTPYWFKD